MRIALGSDHAAFAYKESLREMLLSQGHEVVDLGTNSGAAIDYPAIAMRVGRAVVKGEAETGIFLCGTGVGGSIAANKVRGVRAALCHEAYSARMAREHNDANVLCLGARVTGLGLAEDIVATWLRTEYPGEERHARRLRAIAEAERGAGDG